MMTMETTSWPHSEVVQRLAQRKPLQAEVVTEVQLLLRVEALLASRLQVEVLQVQMRAKQNQRLKLQKQQTQADVEEDQGVKKTKRKAKIKIDLSIFEGHQTADRESAASWVKQALSDGEESDQS